ncbi:EAL domain-containing protein [soil metagenome]
MPRLLGTTLAYFLSTIFAATYLTAYGQTSILWIPSGVGLAVILIGGKKYSPAIFAGALAAHLWTDISWVPAMLIAASSVFETLLNAVLLSRLKFKNSAFNPALTHVRDYVWLMAVAIPTALLCALTGIAILWLAGEVVSAGIPLMVLHWWMGSTLGIVIITPLILVWRTVPSRWLTTDRIVETTACFGLAFLFGQLVFLGWFHGMLGVVANTYWTFLFVAWGAVRFGRHGGLLIAGMSVMQALLGAIQGEGFFANDIADSGLVNLWLFGVVLTVVGVMLALVINERKRTEVAVQESEQRHKTLVEWTPEAIIVYRQRKIVYVNPATVKMFGADSVADLIGKPLIELVHPDFQKLARIRSQSVTQQGIAVPMVEMKFIKLDGNVIDVEVQSTSIVFDGQGAVHVVIRDTTKSKQADRYEQFRSRILESLAGAEPLANQLTALVRGVEKLNPSMLCSILLLDAEGKHLLTGVAPSLPNFFNEAIDGVAIGKEVGSCGASASTNQRIIVEDISTHPYWQPYRELAFSAGLGSCWSQPIRSSAGQVLGTFAIYHHEAHVPNETDLSTIEQSAHLASIAIEKNIAAEKLRDSETHFRLLTEDASDVVWKQDRNNVFSYISPADERMRGFRADEVIGHHVSEMLTPEGIQLLQEKLKIKPEADQYGMQTGSTTFELQQLCKDGSLIWTEVVAKPERNAEGRLTGFHGITRDITKRRQSEEALRIAAIAFESQEGIFVTDTKWEILRVNRAFSEITGYSEQEAIGQTPLLLSSGRHDELFYKEMNVTIKEHGTWQGEIWDKRKSGEVFPAWLILSEVKADDGSVTHYVATLTDITSRKAAEEQIQNLAFFDPLTGLPNRRLLVDRLELAMSSSSRHDRKGALLFIDLDNFKTLNDTLGHDKGDLLLQLVAQRLGTCTREGDTVARLGGDEFVVMLDDLSENVLEAATQAETVGDKILAALNKIYQLDIYEHHSTPSIGITLFGEKQESIDEPLKRADLAMYQAKSAGRNTLRFFDPQMQAVVTSRAALESGIREALVKEQFILYYQAQVAGLDLLTGVEALVRWKHPQRGMVSPAEFIPLAEETGLILQLGEWVLNTACSQLALWAKQPDLAHLSIAVNVSARQFYQRDFVDQVINVLAHTGANPLRLKLELTESLLVSNIEDVIVKMRALKGVGVGFSLDDFGTGYSSLSYLKRLPLDQLKIDQSFVRDILIDSNDAAIAKMVVALADSLGLAVIAEGVETEEQRQFLANQGCHAYQGYLFSRPLALDEFETFCQLYTGGMSANADVTDVADVAQSSV